MYKLPHFTSEDQQEVIGFMKQYPFVFLSGCNEKNEPIVTQVPVFMDEREGRYFLTGHIMRNTDHHKAFMKNPSVLAVFNGPHTYVSATWYDNPYQASTWNYVSVHARGTIRFGENDELVPILKRLTLHYEAGNKASTTIYDNLPDEYKEPLLKAIVPFEIEVDSIENIFKLSQNRNEKSYDNIAEKLSQLDGDAAKIATLMKDRKSKVFPK